MLCYRHLGADQAVFAFCKTVIPPPSILCFQKWFCIGSIGITNIGVWFEPETPSDKDAARRALEWQFDWLTRPIFHPDGNYPEEMIKKIAEISRKENRCVSRLPSFTQEQVDFVKGKVFIKGTLLKVLIIVLLLSSCHFTPKSIFLWIESAYFFSHCNKKKSSQCFSKA